MKRFILILWVTELFVLFFTCISCSSDTASNDNDEKTTEDTIKYRLTADWMSYLKGDKMLNYASSTNNTKTCNKPVVSNSIGKADYVEKNGTTQLPRAILIKYKDGKTSEATAIDWEKWGTYDVAISSEVPYNRIIINDDKSDEQIKDLLTQLNTDSNVEYAEEDGICEAYAVPDDPGYSLQWNFSQMNMPEAWDVTQGDAQVIVAVIDTGVDYRLEDLNKTVFLQGYDFVNDDNSPLDDNGHGSHVTGTLAQSTDNGTGVAGMASGISILPVKVLNASGKGSNSWVAEWIYYAVNNGADIINLSLGSTSSSTTVENACKYAADHGVLIIAAAGNEGEETLDYPAAYDDVMAVGAVDWHNKYTSYSNYNENLTVVAPGGSFDDSPNEQEYGGGILQDTIDGYCYYTGTSMAAPHVSGLAALLKSKNTGFTATEIRNTITASATDLGTTGFDEHYGYGLIDPVSALEQTPYTVTDVLTSSLSKKTSAMEIWRISAAPGSISAAVNYLDDKKSLTLYLENNNGDTVCSGTTTDTGEKLDYKVISAKKGIYYLVIQYTL